MNKVFYGKQRLKSARQAVRLNKEFTHKGENYDCLRDFLDDLVTTLVDQRPENIDAAKAYVIRTMGVLVQREADRAYLPFGYKNPFAPVVPVAPLPSKESVQPEWIWPVVNKPPSSSGNGLDGDGIFRAFSALKLFGYTVGKTEGWPQKRRQQFLSDFMEKRLPAIVASTFGDDYGTPLSSTRLRKVANVIASNASLRYLHDPYRYRDAIQDWESDLAFLKMKYYVGRGLQFQPWPDPKA
ncbi:hypothetical protein RAH32_17390 [Paracoccus sp. WLY502]|uniref:hypothetical protein n=1 Tax=Paracoccus yibinensis TaxID=3068891 RepID=UPI0027965D82|nr:hypothetical protein [Paracoccus sp. WLY502]MDQ1902199.1 hypothetical protein [Paracoccus sp. WLY502]